MNREKMSERVMNAGDENTLKTNSEQPLLQEALEEEFPTPWVRCGM